MFNNELSLAKFQGDGNRKVWVVSSTTIGKALHVYIDDQTGDVIDVVRDGIRSRWCMRI